MSTQGCRSAPTAGLKLANAFGVPVGKQALPKRGSHKESPELLSRFENRLKLELVTDGKLHFARYAGRGCNLAERTRSDVSSGQAKAIVIEEIERLPTNLETMIL